MQKEAGAPEAKRYFLSKYLVLTTALNSKTISILPSFFIYLYSLSGSNNQTELSLVLATPVPVTWHLTVSGLAPAPVILISDGSRVINTATGLELPVSAAILNNKIITENLARAKFSHIHTFTSITAANRIFINLKKGDYRYNVKVWTLIEE